GAAIANLAFANGSRWWASAATSPDAAHSYPIHHHGHVLYYAPFAGRYLEIGFFLVHLACMGALALLYHAYRDRLRHVERPAPTTLDASTGWFVAALVVSPVLLSLVGGFVVGIFWREGAPLSWLLAGALPFPLLSLLGVRGALRTLPDPQRPP